MGLVKRTNGKAIANDNVEFSLQKDGSYTVRSKSYLLDENGNIRRGKPVSVLNGPFTQEGTQEVRDLFDGKSIFDFTKPSELIKYLVGLEANSDSSKDYIILDFFSGSATTAHAVMKLNAEDGGKRKFIMAQVPEITDVKSEARKAGYETICQIGEERIRCASKKIREEAGDKAKALDIGLRVLKLDSSNMEDVFYTPDKFEPSLLDSLVDNIKPDRTPEDLLF